MVNRRNKKFGIGACHLPADLAPADTCELRDPLHPPFGLDGGTQGVVRDAAVHNNSQAGSG